MGKDVEERTSQVSAFCYFAHHRLKRGEEKLIYKRLLEFFLRTEFKKEFKADKFRGEMKQLLLLVSLTDPRNIAIITMVNSSFQDVF